MGKLQVLAPPPKKIIIIINLPTLMTLHLTLLWTSPMYLESIDINSFEKRISKPFTDESGTGGGGTGDSLSMT